MDPESTQPQCCSSLVSPDYIIPNNSLANTLYAQRYYNDRILADIIDIAHKNTSLSARISELKEQTPSFMNNWWETSYNAAEIPNFLNKVEQVLQQQIDAMSTAISQAKTTEEVQELEMQKEQEEEQMLLATKTQLQRQLSDLAGRNNSKEDELNSILSQRDNFYNAIKQLQEIKRMQQLQKTIQDDQNRRITETSRNPSTQDALKDHFTQLKEFITYLLDRKKQIEKATNQSSSQLNKINAQIEQYQHENRVNQVRKENIVSQHLQLKRLKEELARSQQRRNQAEQERADLQRIYCNEEMEKVARDYQALDSRYDTLVGKAINLAKSSTKTAKLKPLERVIFQESQQ